MAWQSKMSPGDQSMNTADIESSPGKRVFGSQGILYFSDELNQQAGGLDAEFLLVFLAT